MNDSLSDSETESLQDAREHLDLLERLAQEASVEDDQLEVDMLMEDEAQEEDWFDDEYVPEDDDDDDEDAMYVDLDDADEVVDEEEGSDDEQEEADPRRAQLNRIIAAALAANQGGRGGTASITLDTLRRLLATGQIHAQAAGGDEEEDDSDDGLPWYTPRGNAKPISHFWEPVTEPVKSGQELLLSGDFGKTPRRPVGSPPSAFAPSRNLADRLRERKYAFSAVPMTEMTNYVPNSNGTEVSRYDSRCYCGQYSEDGSLFYTCTQDFKVHIYDTSATGPKNVMKLDIGRSYGRASLRGENVSHATSLKPIKIIQGRSGQWTITDANLSPDNNWMIYSSITPYVHLVPTRDIAAPDVGDYGNEGLVYDEETGASVRRSDQQVMLDFSDPDNYYERTGVWSIRFSGDSREIVAGANSGKIMVYDIEARKRVLSVSAHTDDVNGVAFADAANSNVLLSGSDDGLVKVWDRRSLGGGKPAGVLPGHTEGITYVSPKGDGRYCLSNGKDQCVKLWDLRSMMTSSAFDRTPDNHRITIKYGLRDWDYRSGSYKQPRYEAHPDDKSVMTYRGHAVLRTLIRAHFSPAATTGQKYIYSGSADGRIHIWSLDGQVVQVLDRHLTTPMYSGTSNAPADPSAPERLASSAEEPSRLTMCTVRDVSWHPAEPSLMSTAWDGSHGEGGSIAKHEWKGFGKNGMSLEDAVEASKRQSTLY